MSRKLNGPELEEWFKDFARSYKILEEDTFKMEEIIKLFDNRLNARLDNARDFIDNYFVHGNEWIDRVLEKRALPEMSEQTKNQFANRLADLVMGTDAVLNIKDDTGKNAKIAVDITSNDIRVPEKLDKIRGLPPKHSNININENIPSTRNQLGIDKHLIILVERERSRLPSYNKLLDTIYTFVNSASKTQAIELINLDPNERVNWRQVEAAKPEQMWQKYSKGIQSKASNVIALEAAKRAFRDDHTPEAVLQMLTHDPQYRQFLRRDNGDSKFADLHAKAIRAGAEVEVTKEQQRKLQQSRGPERGIDGPEI